MIASKLFKEVFSQELSPVILTGANSSSFSKFFEFVYANYSGTDYLIIDSLTSSSVSELKKLMMLTISDLKFVIIDSSTVSTQSWQKLLKTLEDTKPSIQIIIVANSSLPQSVVSRSFRCHIPLTPEPTGEYSGTEAFSVGSWLISVDTRNREQLLKSCQEWSKGHTALLVAEINEQLIGESLLKLNLEKRLSNPNKLMAALFMLNEYLNVPTAHIYTGLRLMV